MREGITQFTPGYSVIREYPDGSSCVKASPNRSAFVVTHTSFGKPMIVGNLSFRDTGIRNGGTKARDLSMS